MNKYTKQGRGRNRSEQRPFGLSGLARRLFSRIDPAIAVLPTLSAPHQGADETSARENRRHHGATVRYTPQRVDPLLGRSRIEVIDAESWRNVQIGRNLRDNHQLSLYQYLYGARRAGAVTQLRAVHDSVYATEVRSMDAFTRQLRQAFALDSDAILQSAFVNRPPQQPLRVPRINPVGFSTRGLDPDARIRFMDNLRDFSGVEMRIDPVSSRVLSLQQIGRARRTEPRGLFNVDLESLSTAFGNFSQAVVSATENVSEAFRRMADSPAFLAAAKAELEAQEKREIEARLAGRKPGDVIRRPRRSYLGIVVIDEIQEDGHIARKAVQPQPKEKGST